MSIDKTFKLGLLVTGVAISSAWAIGRGQPAHLTWPDGSPMAEESTEALSSSNISHVLWDLPVTRNSHVDAHIKFLQGRNAKLTERWLERSGRYTPLIKTELHKRGMPEDLVYLAFIESG
ncbi:MAG TPA: hypothetical protein VM100_10215, partial [Longimicrobiales bacterium]|nr:hypothetical protein [Longimicrobiales bacterium]